jgi:hypothetical protein
MKKNLITVATISIAALLLAACTQQPVQPAPTATPAAMMQNDASISGQIDISDDAVTQKESTKSVTPKQKMDEETDSK